MQLKTKEHPKIEICDLMGRRLFQSTIDGNSMDINVSSLTNAVYFIRISIADELFVKKMIKQ